MNWSEENWNIWCLSLPRRISEVEVEQVTSQQNCVALQLKSRSILIQGNCWMMVTGGVLDKESVVMWF